MQPSTGSSFDKTVQALIDSFVRQHEESSDVEARVDSASAFVLATHAAMPDYLRFAFRVLTTGFGLSSYALKGRPFHNLDAADRAAQIQEWGSSRLQFRRALIEFYQTFAAFGLYSDLYQQDYDFLPASTA